MGTAMETATKEEAPADGRLLRSERSLRSIVLALFELVGEGVLRPTAQKVAERAGVGIRTVFRHFSDMDTLFAEMDARLQSEVVPLVRATPLAGPLDARVRELVQRRAELYERVAPYLRATDVQRWQSEFLMERHRSLTRNLRADLLRWIPELRDAPPDVAAGLELATCFEAWDRLRTAQRLTPKRAQAALERLALHLASDLGS